MFMLYELANFNITTATINRELFAVEKHHQAHKIPAPFKDNEVVREMFKEAIKRDTPSKSKMPIIDRQMEAVRDALDLSTRQGFCLWAGLRFFNCNALQEGPRAHCTLLLEEYHNTKLSGVLEEEAETNAQVDTPGNAPTNASANSSANLPANAPTNTSVNTPTTVQGAGAHPLVALVANKQDTVVEFFAQANTEALAAEATV